MPNTDCLLIKDVEAFLDADYAGRDTMHDLTHIHRIRLAAERLATEAGIAYDPTILQLGAYLHGVIHLLAREEAARSFFIDRGVPASTIDRAVRAAHESLADAQPETPEGILLHDGHLLEGGRSFMLVKSLVTGAARGSSLRDIAAFWRKNVSGRRRCVLPAAQAYYAEQEAFARAVFDELAPHLEAYGGAPDSPTA